MAQVVMSIRDLAKVRYGVESPTKSQMNVISEQCRSGRIKNAQKIAGQWIIDCSREWPSVFPETEEVAQVVYVERMPVITADMRLGDALAVLLDALVGKEQGSERKRSGAV